MPIAIVDYGAGNLRSVQKALHSFGIESILTKNSSEIVASSGVILPGVGAFDAAISELRKNNLEMAIGEAIALQKPFLGICLGYQMLFDESEEGKLKGLSILKGKVRKFNFEKSSFEKLSIPHMGWNNLKMEHKSELFSGTPSSSMVYFAHSYYCDPEDKLIIPTTHITGI